MVALNKCFQTFELSEYLLIDYMYNIRHVCTWYTTTCTMYNVHTF